MGKQLTMFQRQSNGFSLADVSSGFVFDSVGKHAIHRSNILPCLVIHMSIPLPKQNKIWRSSETKKHNFLFQVHFVVENQELEEIDTTNKAGTS